MLSPLQSCSETQKIACSETNKFLAVKPLSLAYSGGCNWITELLLRFAGTLYFRKLMALYKELLCKFLEYLAIYSLWMLIFVRLSGI